MRFPVLALALLALLAAAPAAQATIGPVNDNFASAITVTHGSSTLGTSVGSTAQTGEPDNGGFNGDESVWYRYTPASTRAVFIDICDASFDSTLGVYTGASVDALTEVTTNDDQPAICPGGLGASAVAFQGVAGTSYFIRVSAYEAATGGPFTIHVDAPPTNDHLGSASVIYPGSRTGGEDVWATTQGTEQHHGPGSSGPYHSVWYRFNATRTGPLRVAVCSQDINSNLDTVLGMHSGANPLAVLGSAASPSNDDALGGECPTNSPPTHGSAFTTQMTAGTSYWFAVDSFGSGVGILSTGLFTISLSPANDLFAGASDLKTSDSQSDTTFLGTAETNEPAISGVAAHSTAWYTWTAPAGAGPTTVNTCGSYLHTVLGVFTGASVGALTKVAEDGSDTTVCGSGTNSSVTFTPTPGTAYSFAVDSDTDKANYNYFTINVGAPANDSFDSPQPVTGAAPAEVVTDNGASSRQQGEPGYLGYSPSRSNWFTWTALGDGATTIDTCGSGLSTRLGVYTGTALNALTQVAAAGYNSGCAKSNEAKVAFTAVAGTTYRFSVDGAPNSVVKVHLTGQPAPPPPPDTTPTTPTVTTPVPPPPALVGAITLSKSSSALLGHGTFAVGVRCSRACSLRGVLDVPRTVARRAHLAKRSAARVTIGRLTGSVSAAGTVKAKVTLTRRARRHIKRGTKLTARLTLTITDTANHQVTIVHRTVSFH